MGSNGQSVFDVFGRGYKRTVISINGNGTAGVSLPGDLRDEHDIDLGDDVVVYDGDEDGVLELHFESE